MGNEGGRGVETGVGKSKSGKGEEEWGGREERRGGEEKNRREGEKRGPEEGVGERGEESRLGEGGERVTSSWLPKFSAGKPRDPAHRVVERSLFQSGQRLKFNRNGSQAS